MYPPLSLETADLGLACWFMVSRRAQAPVAAGGDAGGDATEPGLAPNGSLNQQSSLGGATEGAKAGEWIAAESKCYLHFAHPSLCSTLPAGGLLRHFQKTTD
jgi:hypothetical protein